MKILKDLKHNTVLFAVLEPNEVDRNGDSISEREIILSAHEFLLNLDKKWFNFDHEEGTDTNGAKLVESYILPLEYKNFKAWTWVIWVKFSNSMYKKIISWEILWVSIEWKWERKKG